MNTITPSKTASPFHAGEHHLQRQLGVRESMEQFGSKVIRDYLPEQHQDFYHHLPYVIIGHADSQGWPWASVLCGEPGFLHSPDPDHLNIHTTPVAGDPLQHILQPGAHIGLLGIDLRTRRRNRLAAHITESRKGTVQLRVDQSFGNCPQYIQARTLSTSAPHHSSPETQLIHQFDQHTRTFIEQSDTFFVASYVPAQEVDASRGADVSHRGGQPGFIRVDNTRKLTIPDYPGNHHFNTLGNFIENPKAGLLFIDFERGHVLMLTGRVAILEEVDHPYYKGAERFWTFTLEHGRWIKNALPLRWHFDEYSPNSLLAGNWAHAAAAQKADTLRDQWLDYQVVRIQQESLQVKSFYLQPPADISPDIKPGQFLTVKATIDGKEHSRTYTVSSAPADTLLRISVKHEQGSATIPPGVFSRYLHQSVATGSTLQVKMPRGEFVLTEELQKPVLLLSAGIGITPMLAMARHIFQEGLRTRTVRPVLFIHSARSAGERAFYDDIMKLADHHPAFKTVWVLSQPEHHLVLGREYDVQGRINKALLQNHLPTTELDVFLCGPGGFMQAQYDALSALGVADGDIYAESFGPASLQRDSAKPEFNLPPANQAVVKFNQSGIEMLWQKGDGSLLEFAEKHGLSPEFGCRHGQCGRCKTKLLHGKVSYQQPPAISLTADDVLICCAVPAADPHTEQATLVLDL